MLIKLIINPLSATPSLAIEPVSSVIVLPIDPEPEELVGDGIFLQINGDDVFLEEFADGGVDNAGRGKLITTYEIRSFQWTNYASISTHE